MSEEMEFEFGLMGADCTAVECTNINCGSTGSTGSTVNAIPAKIERCIVFGEVKMTHCGCGYFY